MVLGVSGGRRVGAARVLACARRRAEGNSFIGYFVLSLFFFPLALIMAYAVQNRYQVA
jgi:hypothetical protein